MQDRAATEACASVTRSIYSRISPGKITIKCNYRKGLSCRRGIPDAGRGHRLFNFCSPFTQMLTHVATTLKGPSLFSTLISQGAPAPLRSCIPLVVRRRAPSATRFRALVTSQPSLSSDTEKADILQPESPAPTAESSTKRSSSGRDFLKFAYGLRKIPPQVGIPHTAPRHHI